MGDIPHSCDQRKRWTRTKKKEVDEPSSAYIWGTSFAPSAVATTTNVHAGHMLTSYWYIHLHTHFLCYSLCRQAAPCTRVAGDSTRRSEICTFCTRSPGAYKASLPQFGPTQTFHPTSSDFTTSAERPSCFFNQVASASNSSQQIPTVRFRVHALNSSCFLLRVR